MLLSELVEKTIPIIRMDCPTCIPVLEREVLKLNGVENVRGNYLNKTLKISYDPSKVQLKEIENAIERIGYRISYKKYPGPISRLKSLLKRDNSIGVDSIKDSDFLRKVLNSSMNVAVLFSSRTCPSCQIFKPEFQKLSESLKDQAVLYEMDIAKTEIWRDYNILSIPTVLVFKDGKVIKQFTAIPKIEMIKEALEH